MVSNILTTFITSFIHWHAFGKQCSGSINEDLWLYKCIATLWLDCGFVAS